ncbi:MAG: sulfotransferase [Actinobacteria bacterium]|nr:sulfotransferase [Actinomycetota bacterium]
MFFIVGSARSGTTLIRIIFNAHSAIAVPPESRFVVELYEGAEEIEVDGLLVSLAAHKRFQAWDLPIEAIREGIEGPRAAYADIMEAAYRAYARARGKSCWGDKTPRYIENLPLLANLFPHALFIHIVRDGRNVALSYSEVPFGPKTVAKAAALWGGRVSKGLEAGRALGPDRYIEVTYEDFVVAPEPHLRRLCDFIDVEFEPGMLDYKETASDEILGRAARYNPLVRERPRAEVRAWKDQMSPQQVEIFEAVAGDVLSELGYERLYPAPGARARVVAALARAGLPVGRLKHLTR